MAALTGGVVTSAVNVPAISAEDLEVLGPYVPLCRSLGRIAIALAVAEGGSVDQIQTDFFGRLAERDTRLLSIEALLGVLAGHTEEDINAVTRQPSPRSGGSGSSRPSSPRRATTPISSASR